jgi:hypothetical protein
MDLVGFRVFTFEGDDLDMRVVHKINMFIEIEEGCKSNSCGSR